MRLSTPQDQPRANFNVEPNGDWGFPLLDFGPINPWSRQGFTEASLTWSWSSGPTFRRAAPYGGFNGLQQALGGNGLAQKRHRTVA